MVDIHSEVGKKIRVKKSIAVFILYVLAGSV